MKDAERRELIQLIDELDLDSGSVYKVAGVWYADGKNLDSIQPRLGRGTKLTMSVDSVVIIEGIIKKGD